MGGKGGKVVTAINAVAHAVTHAAGWLEGITRIVDPITKQVKALADWIDKTYDRITRWVKEEFKPLTDVYNKYYTWYKRELKPALDRLSKSIDKLATAYTTLKLAIEGKINKLFAYIYSKVEPKFREIDRLLRNLQQLVSAFDRKLAQSIANLRAEIYKHTLKVLYDAERRIMQKTHQIFVPFDKFFGTIEAFKRDHIDPLQKGLEGLSEGLKAVLTPEKKPQPSFAFESGNIYGRQMLEAWLGAFREWEIEVGPIEIEEVEIYETLKKQTADDPKKIPQEEKELYEIFEKRALMQ